MLPYHKEHTPKKQQAPTPEREAEALPPLQRRLTGKSAHQAGFRTASWPQSSAGQKRGLKTLNACHDDVDQSIA